MSIFAPIILRQKKAKMLVQKSFVQNFCPKKAHKMLAKLTPAVEHQATAVVNE
jgi:hypothetical protein